MSYHAWVKDKTAEEILANNVTPMDVPMGEYMRVAAQVRSNQELIGSLQRASDDSSKLGNLIAVLTCALVFVGATQAIATAWPYLVWWWHH